MRILKRVPLGNIRPSHRRLDPHEASFQERLFEKIEQVFRSTPPSWAAYESVAVNPFYGLREMPFGIGLSEISRSTHQDLLPSKVFFRQKLKEGEITGAAISEALSFLGKESELSVQAVLSQLHSS